LTESKKRQGKVIKEILICIFIYSNLLLGQWSTDPRQNTPVNIQEYAQIYPLVCSDSKGGAIVLFIERGKDFYMQRIDRFGYIRWGPAGLPVFISNSQKKPVEIISDGVGGAIILWRDYRELPIPFPHEHPSNTLYVQRIDSCGNILWNPEGVKLSPFRFRDNVGIDPGWKYSYPTAEEKIVSDSEGGVFVCWSLSNDSLSDLGKTEAFIQHVSSTGNALWEEMGKSVGMIYSRIKLVTNGEGGVYYIVAGNIYQFNASGDPMWDTPINAAISIGGSSQYVSDGKGGLIGVGCYRNYSDPDDLVFQRFDRYGNTLWGDVTFKTTGDIHYPRANLAYSDGKSGILVSWQMGDSENWKVYTQHVDSSGVIQFPSPGINSHIHCTNPDGEWFYLHNESDTTYRVYVQKYSTEGTPLWGDKGALVKIRKEYMNHVGCWQCISDDNGGVIMVWDETSHMTQYYDIMAQLVNAHGELGNVITTINNHTSNLQDIPFELRSNYPNPFNQSTTIKYSIYKEGNYLLTIFDVKGREIYNEQLNGKMPGDYEFEWNTKNMHGNLLSSGIYIFTLSDCEVLIYNKLLLIK
jgi:hypothetical protein